MLNGSGKPNKTKQAIEKIAEGRWKNPKEFGVRELPGERPPKTDEDWLTEFENAVDTQAVAAAGEDVGPGVDDVDDLAGAVSSAPTGPTPKPAPPTAVEAPKAEPEQSVGEFARKLAVDEGKPLVTPPEDKPIPTTKPVFGQKTPPRDVRLFSNEDKPMEELFDALHPGVEGAPKINPGGHGTMPSEPLATAVTKSKLNPNQEARLRRSMEASGVSPESINNSVNIGKNVEVPEPVPAVKPQGPSKSVEDMMEQQGITTGEPKTRGGGLVTQPTKGLALSSTENKAPGKLEWTRNEFGKESPKAEVPIESQLKASLKAKGKAPKAEEVDPYSLPEGPERDSAIKAQVKKFFSSEEGSLDMSGVNEVGRKARDKFHEYVKVLPDYQRFALLFSQNLPINTWVGPYGSALTGAAEAAMKGDARGNAALKALANPFGKFKQGYIAARNSGEATELLEHANSVERAEWMESNVHPAIKKILSLPGNMMTSGDISARNILMDAGFTLEEARRMTLTSEPQWALSRGIMALRRAKSAEEKDSIIGQMMLPFARTNLNQFEQSIDRMPILGAVKAAMNSKFNGREQAVQQFIGSVVAAGSFSMGMQMDPTKETVGLNQSRLMKKLLQDFSGQYGTVASAAFLAGQAYAAGKNVPQALYAGAAGSLHRDLPLPTNQPLADMSKLLKGENPIPSSLQPVVLKLALKHLK